jgi:hypothetical protein
VITEGALTSAAVSSCVSTLGLPLCFLLPPATSSPFLALFREGTWPSLSDEAISSSVNKLSSEDRDECPWGPTVKRPRFRTTRGDGGRYADQAGEAPMYLRLTTRKGQLNYILENGEAKIWPLFNKSCRRMTNQRLKIRVTRTEASQ